MLALMRRRSACLSAEDGRRHGGASGAACPASVVLELAGVKNAFGKQLGSGNPLNNARAAVEGLKLQRTVEMVAKERGLTVAQMLQHKPA